MANELTLNGLVSYQDSEGADVALSLTGLAASVTTKRYVKDKQNVGTVAAAINLGSVTSLGWAVFINRDPTNYIELLTGTGGKVFAKMLAGQMCGPLFLGSDCQAPFARANTAACQMEFLIVSA